MTKAVGALFVLAMSWGCVGPEGPMGPPGIQGEPGRDGAVGAQGPRGEPGAIVTSDGGTLTLQGSPYGGGVDVANVVGGIANDADAVVIVQCTSDGESFSFGTGTKTASGTVLTAHHVVEDAPDCDVFSEAPVRHLGSVVEAVQHGERDQMELIMEWNDHGAAIEGLEPFFETLPVLGDFLVIIGHPGVGSNLALEHQYTTGYVTSASASETLNNLARGAYWSQGYITDAVAWHGNSGGPVFNEYGEWIGLLVGSLNGGSSNTGPDLTIAIPLL